MELSVPGGELHRFSIRALDQLVETKDTLVAVNWSLHVVSERYLPSSGSAERYSNVDGLPALLVVVYREKEDIRYE
jgi:hypothetical protein